jgi:predicted metal-dependent hydrolase
MSDDFLNQEAFQELSRKVAEAHETLGMSIMGQQAQIDPSTGDVVLMTAALVRKTAFENVTADLDTRRAVQRIAAEEAQSALDKRVEQYTKAIEEGRILDVLTGQDQLVHCSHERIHEGLCLDCHEEVTSET